MLNSLAAPLAVTSALAVVATSTHRFLPPRVAARFVTAALLLVTFAAVPTALLVGLAFLAHVPWTAFGFRWCAQAVGLHGSVPTWLGLPAVLLIVIGAARMLRLIRQHRSLRVRHVHPIHVEPSCRPFAVTLPGRAGQIVVSTALLELLDDDEQRIVVAHEEAHARCRHDRYLLIAALAAAAVPPLRAVARRVTYSIERWADEAAVAACGDRRLVARTLGKVALHGQPPTVAGFAGLGVAARMRALLDPPVRDLGAAQFAAVCSSLVVTAGFSLYQLHHLERLLPALCRHGLLRH